MKGAAENDFRVIKFYFYPLSLYGRESWSLALELAMVGGRYVRRERERELKIENPLLSSTDGRHQQLCLPT
jgi:hypothetical protein